MLNIGTRKVKALKTNNSGTKINFEKRNNLSEVKLPESLPQNDFFQVNLSMLDRLNPEKIFYSIKEASKILSISDDFVGRRVRSGKIKSTKFGDRHMINKITLAQIMTEGA